jgi:MoxR-like ATPase
MYLEIDKQNILSDIKKHINSDSISRKQLVAACKDLKIKWPHWFVSDDRFKLSRGVYSLTLVEIQEDKKSVFSDNQESKLMTPQHDSLYIKNNIYGILSKVLQSEMFYPVYISGLSGNGKTLTVEQVCSNLNKKLVRVNLTTETEEDDLLGGFRLINGETKWFDGPVVLAMKEGAVLLLDEVDLASTKIMCIQSILEGRGVFLKKIGVYVSPKDGFNVIATANTKGQGDDTGKFLGANVLNEAFLERFPLWLEQEYPTSSQEMRILNKQAKHYKLDLMTDKSVSNILEALTLWAVETREAYKNEVSDDIITTRRLVHILKAYKITNDIKQAVKMCLNRFNKESQESLYTLFLQFVRPHSIAEDLLHHSETTVIETPVEHISDDELPF